MSNRQALAAVALLAASQAMTGCLGALTIHADDDVTTDDDDDATWGDDPTDAPPYTGTVDVDGADVDWRCADAGDGTGEHRFDARLGGWAFRCWIELSDGDYCEGYLDAGAGTPCEHDGVARPGWGMRQGPFGWDEAQGYWDSWALTLSYSDTWPPDDDVSALGCGAQAALCCTDAHDGTLHRCAGLAR